MFVYLGYVTQSTSTCRAKQPCNWFRRCWWNVMLLLYWNLFLTTCYCFCVMLCYAIAVPVSVQVSASESEPPLHGNTSLTCRVTAWPHRMLLVWSRGPLASGPSDPWWLAVGRNETTVTTSDSISINNATSSSGSGVSANERSTLISVTTNGGGSESQSPASLPIADSGVTANRGNGAHRIVDLTHDSHAQVVGDGTVQDDDVTSSSQLLLNDLSREQNATYYCYAYNAENNMTAMSSHHVQVIGKHCYDNDKQHIYTRIYHSLPVHLDEYRYFYVLGHSFAKILVFAGTVSYYRPILRAFILYEQI